MQRDPRRGAEVEHGDVAAERQPVGAGGGDAGAPQRPDHRLEERPARAHEDQDVARREPGAAAPLS